MGQARMKLNFGDLRTVLLFNLGASSSGLFPILLIERKSHLFHLRGGQFCQGLHPLLRIWGSGLAHSGDTNAFTFGARAEHLFTWEFLSLDQVILEAQVPLQATPTIPSPVGTESTPL